MKLIPISDLAALSVTLLTQPAAAESALRHRRSGCARGTVSLRGAFLDILPLLEPLAGGAIAQRCRVAAAPNAAEPQPNFSYVMREIFSHSLASCVIVIIALVNNASRYAFQATQDKSRCIEEKRAGARGRLAYCCRTCLSRDCGRARMHRTKA